MKHEQFKELTSPDFNCESAFSKYLKDRKPRTLLYGYTVERHTFHLYMGDDGQLHRVIYDHRNLLVNVKHESEGLELEECIPNKQLYPEACDFVFCGYLMSFGLKLPFNTWTARDEARVWHGLKLEELNASFKASDLEIEPIELTLADIGLDAYVYDQSLLPKLQSTIVGQMKGSLAVSVLEADNPLSIQKAGLWLQRIPEVIETSVRRLLGLAEDAYALSEEKRDAIVRSAADKVTQRSLALLARS